MPGVEISQILEQADRIAASPVLHNAESLCNLLRFLVRQAVENPLSSVKEHQIATEVFHRSTDFDPRLDSTVRVQTSRLRSKLSEYYGGPGAADAVVLEIPKGSYSLHARPRTNGAHPPPAEDPADDHVKPEPVLAPSLVAPVAVPVPAPAESPAWKLAAIVLALSLFAVIGWTLANRAPAAPAPATTAAPEPSLSTFWRQVLTSPEPPLIVFSNAEFVGRPETGLRYYNKSRDTGSPILDHYTGVGEVLAVQQLASMFGRLNTRFQVKRSRLLNWDDTKSRDLIFIGSPTENLSLRELPLNDDFRFETVAEGPRKGDLGIRNLHPRDGEAPVYLGSKDLPIREDYAIVSLAPGPAAKQSVLLLAGTTTFGTEAAVEFVSQPSTVELLLQKQGGKLKPFVGVIRTEIKGGVPVNMDLAAWREIAKK